MHEENDSAIDENYFRVTDILFPFSGAEFVPKHILEKAALKGSLVHKYIECYLKGEDFLIHSESLEPYLEAFHSFFSSNIPDLKQKSFDLEKRFYHQDLMLTGCVDIIIQYPDKTLILDWKTSSSPQKSWNLQAAAYRWLATQQGYSNVDARFIHLKKDGKFTIKKFKNYDDDIQTFMKCFDLYKWFDMKKTRCKSIPD